MANQMRNLRRRCELSFISDISDCEDSSSSSETLSLLDVNPANFPSLRRPPNFTKSQIRRHFGLPDKKIMIASTPNCRLRKRKSDALSDTSISLSPIEKRNSVQACHIVSTKKPGYRRQLQDSDYVDDDLSPQAMEMGKKERALSPVQSIELITKKKRLSLKYSTKKEHEVTTILEKQQGAAKNMPSSLIPVVKLVRHSLNGNNPKVNKSIQLSCKKKRMKSEQVKSDTLKNKVEYYHDLINSEASTGKDKEKLLIETKNTLNRSLEINNEKQKENDNKVNNKIDKTNVIVSEGNSNILMDTDSLQSLFDRIDNDVEQYLGVNNNNGEDVYSPKDNILHYWKKPFKSLKTKKKLKKTGFFECTFGNKGPQDTLLNTLNKPNDNTNRNENILHSILGLPISSNDAQMNNTKEHHHTSFKLHPKKLSSVDREENKEPPDEINKTLTNNKVTEESVQQSINIEENSNERNNIEVNLKETNAEAAVNNNKIKNYKSDKNLLNTRKDPSFVNSNEIDLNNENKSIGSTKSRNTGVLSGNVSNIRKTEVAQKEHKKDANTSKKKSIEILDNKINATITSIVISSKMNDSNTIIKNHTMHNTKSLSQELPKVKKSGKSKGVKKSKKERNKREDIIPTIRKSERINKSPINTSTTYFNNENNSIGSTESRRTRVLSVDVNNIRESEVIQNVTKTTKKKSIKTLDDKIHATNSNINNTNTTIKNSTMHNNNSLSQELSEVRRSGKSKGVKKPKKERNEKKDINPKMEKSKRVNKSCRGNSPNKIKKLLHDLLQNRENNTVYSTDISNISTINEDRPGVRKSTRTRKQTRTLSLETIVVTEREFLKYCGMPYKESTYSKRTKNTSEKASKKIQKSQFKLPTVPPPMSKKKSRNITNKSPTCNLPDSGNYSMTCTSSRSLQIPTVNNIEDLPCNIQTSLGLENDIILPAIVEECNDVMTDHKNNDNTHKNVSGICYNLKNKSSEMQKVQCQSKNKSQQEMCDDDQNIVCTNQNEIEEFAENDNHIEHHVAKKDKRLQNVEKNPDRLENCRKVDGNPPPFQIYENNNHEVLVDHVKETPQRRKSDKKTNRQLHHVSAEERYKDNDHETKRNNSKINIFGDAVCRKVIEREDLKKKVSETISVSTDTESIQSYTMFPTNETYYEPNNICYVINNCAVKSTCCQNKPELTPVKGQLGIYLGYYQSNRDLGFCTCSTGLMQIDPNCFKGLCHFKTSHAFYFVIEGEAEITLSQRKMLVHADESFFIPLGQDYSIKNTSNTQKLLLSFINIKAPKLFT